MKQRKSSILVQLAPFPTSHKQILSAMFVFLFFFPFFVSLVIGLKRRCQWCSQSAQRRGVVDQ